MYLYYFLTSYSGNKKLLSKSGGSAQTNIAKREEVESISILLPKRDIIQLADKMLNQINIDFTNNVKERKLLDAFKTVVLSKISIPNNLKEAA